MTGASRTWPASLAHAPRDDRGPSLPPRGPPRSGPRPRFNPHSRGLPRGSVQPIVSEVPRRPFVQATLYPGTSDTILCIIRSSYRGRYPLQFQNLGVTLPQPSPERRNTSMPIQAVTYRVLIASPSDLAEERQAATEAIHEWNAQHAAAESVVLLPVKWETHATPETGIRPQEAINTQIVRTADMLIGLFWTKLGTTTGVADRAPSKKSISSLHPASPPCSISQTALIEPSRIDLDQLSRILTHFQGWHLSACSGRRL